MCQNLVCRGRGGELVWLGGKWLDWGRCVCLRGLRHKWSNLSEKWHTSRLMFFQALADAFSFFENFDFWALGAQSWILNGLKIFRVLFGRHKWSNLSEIWHADSLGEFLGMLFSFFENFDLWDLGTQSSFLNGPKSFRVL